MKELSISQSYLLCTLNEKGKISSLDMEATVCFIASTVFDLVFSKSVRIDDKKIYLLGELSENLCYLKSIYDVIAKKGEIKINKLVTDYCMGNTTTLKLLLNDTGNSLDGTECVEIRMGGLFGKTTCFVPHAEKVDRIIQTIRAEILEEGLIAEEIVALICLLDKSRQLKQYFSNYEKDILKRRLKELKNDPANQLVTMMLECMSAIMAAVCT